MSQTPLFNPRVLEKELAAAAFPDDLAERHARLAPLLAQQKSGELRRTNETQLQGDFVRTVFGDILGYRTRFSHGGDAWDIEREENVAKGGRQAADGAIGWFEAGNDPVIHAVIELKGAAQSLDSAGGRDKTPVTQAYDYCLETRTCRWILVSNYRETRLYHRNRSRRDIEVFQLADLEDFDAFKRFWLLLARDRLLPPTPDGQAPLDRLLLRSDRAQQEITRKLYKEYREVRDDLFANLCRHHSNLPKLEVLGHTQKLLDRVLFVAFAEDRGLLPAETIDKAITPDHWDRPFWENLKKTFEWVDQGKQERGFPPYNGGLFAEDPMLDALEPSNETLAGLGRIAKYDFSSDVTVDVLGHIFEQSITDLEDLRARAAGEEKKGASKRKKDGVFYTPGYVTRYLVDQTLGRTLREHKAKLLARHNPDKVRGKNKKNAAWLAMWTEYRDFVRQLQVLDPACGSGAFLIAAFDYLLDEYNSIDRTLAELRGGQRELWDLNKAILNGNLFGVDLNPESIEITKLSLWLKTASQGNKLTWLDGNIRCGNSVVSDPTIAPRAFDWGRGSQVGDWTEYEDEDKAKVAASWRRGFQVVVGNPPYVRQEWFVSIKPHLQEHYESFDGKADLFVYFFERALSVLEPGGRLGFIVANKWLKGGYAGPLRKLLTNTTCVEQLVDFGHAPIFPDADAFPSIIVVRKLVAGEEVGNHDVQTTQFPREELGNATIGDFVDSRRVAVPQSTLGETAWSLEPPAVRELMAHMRDVGNRLYDVVGMSPLYGLKTGFNKAFLLSQHEADGLLASGCPPNLLRNYLRGSSVERWRPGESGELLLLLKSSGDYTWPWSGKPEKEAERVFASSLAAVHTHMKQHESRLRKRTDQGHYWWELRSCAYYELFDEPKIVYQDILWTGSFALDCGGLLANNTVYFLPTSDRWLLAVLNSPLMWGYLWRNAQHGKDEALRMFGEFVVDLPVPPPPPGSEPNELVGQAVAHTRADQQAVRDLLDWLATEFGIDKFGRKLPAAGSLDSNTFVAEVKKRQDKSRGRLTPADLRSLRDAHEELRAPMLKRAAALRTIERRLSDLVNQAFGLSEEQIDLVRRTAPPRMPPGLQ